MKEATSKLVMGATLVMVVSLAIVLALVLLLLAELYCSLLLRKRRLRMAMDATADIASSPSLCLERQDPSAPPLNSFYTHGVLRAPRSFLFPAISGKEDDNVEVAVNKQFPATSKQVSDTRAQETDSNQHCVSLLSAPSPSISFTSIGSPRPIAEVELEGSSGGVGVGEGGGFCGGSGGENFVYISNPIYDNDACRPDGVGTPFETPDTSPSRLEADGSSGEDDKAEPSPSSPSPLPMTPPLTPMKKLPAEACSVSLRDVRSLGTSGSGSDTNNGPSSSSSGSPCTSPSW
ncbi:PREDICTED: uncharacterized protein LOC104592228 [Nelumbo nucifera]|uniref:Uncharacterized protein LOC104592228 n=1 Tax=Nelumbo nucifera TaxID=4432 RepID=A0A1U7Z8K7_NELNU|nr:PREDICTED: uncharacterized protein LOC104592228 [Nelumbo nucifera]